MTPKFRFFTVHYLFYYTIALGIASLLYAIFAKHPGVAPWWTGIFFYFIPSWLPIILLNTRNFLSWFYSILFSVPVIFPLLYSIVPNTPLSEAGLRVTYGGHLIVFIGQAYFMRELLKTYFRKYEKDIFPPKEIPDCGPQIIKLS
jgi:hypothetical protein